MTNSSFQDHQQFGSQLRQLREAQHLGLEEIAAQTKIPLRFIDYLERGDFAKLPLPFFTRNYITGLCRLYDTDPQPFLEYYGKVSGFNAPVEAAITPPSQSGGGLQRPGSIGLKGDVQVPANASGASAEAANFSASSFVRSIFTIFSMPLRPMIAGTPMQMSFWPYSPSR